MAAKTQGGIRLSAVSGADPRGASRGGLLRGRFLFSLGGPRCGGRRGGGAVWQPGGAGAPVRGRRRLRGRALWGAAVPLRPPLEQLVASPRWKRGAGVCPGWGRRLASPGVKSCRPNVGKGGLRSPSPRINQRLASGFLPSPRRAVVWSLYWREKPRVPAPADRAGRGASGGPRSPAPGRGAWRAVGALSSSSAQNELG